MKHVFNFTKVPRSLEDLNEIEAREYQRRQFDDSFFDTLQMIIYAGIFVLSFTYGVAYLSEHLVKFETEISRSMQ